MLRLHAFFLLFLSISAFTEEERFIPPWQESVQSKVRRTEKPFVFMVARRSAFPNHAEAEAFAKTRTDAKVFDIKTSWNVIYFEEFDIAPLFTENERVLWKSGLRNYALWLAFNGKYDHSDYIRNGKYCCHRISHWAVDESAETIARLKHPDTVIKSENFMQGEKQYVRTTYEHEIPLKSAAEMQFLTYSRAMEHLLIRPIKNIAVKVPTMRAEIMSAIYQLPGFVVNTYYPTENRVDGMTVECSVLDDRSQALQLLVRLFFIPQDYAIKPQLHQIDGSIVLATSKATGWVTKDNRVYMTWGDPKNAIRAEYLKSFPSALDTSFDFKQWMQREVDLAVSQMRTSIAAGNLDKYFWAYLHLSQHAKTEPKAPVLGPPYYEGVTLEVAQWHFKRVEAWLARIDEKKEAFELSDVPTCFLDALRKTIRWRDVGPDVLGAAAANLDLDAYQQQKKEADLAMRRQIPSDEDLKKTALIEMADYLEKKMAQEAQYRRNLKREEDAWSHEWQSALGAWHAIRVTGPELVVRREDPVSASAIFSASGKGVATIKYYFRFDTLKKVWSECRLSP